MYEEARDLRIFNAIEELSDRIWEDVVLWDNISKFTVGSQLVRSIDSVTANREEADGRYHFRDKIRFLYIARGSRKEAGRWVEKSARRSLFKKLDGDKITKDIDNLMPQMNAYISKKRTRFLKSKEKTAPYKVEEEDV